ncbi:MAG: PCRF domain-containing protein, partial [Pseudomonadota bacterium]
MIAREKIQQIVQRFGFLEAKLSGGAAPDELATLSKEYSDLKPVAEEAQSYLTLLDDLKSAEAMLDDAEMAELAREEIAELETAKPALEEKMRLALIPKDAADDRPAILEIRPGTGGDEAALFAGDLWKMYVRFAEARGWKT